MGIGKASIFIKTDSQHTIHIGDISAISNFVKRKSSSYNMTHRSIV